MPQLSLFLIFMIIITGYPNPAESTNKKAINNSYSGPVINVTKRLFFPDFSSSYNPTTSNHQDIITLLGSSIISKDYKCVEIPDAAAQQADDDLRHLAGRAIYSSPIRLFDPVTQTPASFQTTFSFQFQSSPKPSSNSSAANHSTTSSVDYDINTGGSGLTFIIVPDEFTVGRPGPWLGMLNDVCDDAYKAVAIEFDARQNPEFGDPNDNHVGINLGSIVSKTAINASDVGVYLKDGSVHRAWIFYDGQKRYVDIYLGKDEPSTLPSKPLFSGPLDLSPFLKEYMFVGFSASTGNHSQIHKIFSWNFTSSSQASLRLPSTETCESKIIISGNDNKQQRARTEPPSSFLIFLSVVILVTAALLSLYLNARRKDHKSDDIAIPEPKQRPRPPNKPRRFSFAEISSATRCFNELQILGSDPKSVTYKAAMLNGGNVAVKRFLTRFFASNGLDKRRVRKEIKGISKIRHPNLVPIRGWCFDNNETIVVYDYIPNGSLAKWVFGVGVLPWTRRFKVIKDVAEALSHLHSKQLAQKNVKASSVFLDVSSRALLGDFGFLLPSAESTRFESVVSQTADVFEFGVLILEVVAGRGRRSERGETDLLELSWSLHERDDKVRLVDRTMGAGVNTEQAVRVLDIGLLCTLNDNKGGPIMEEVVEFLNMERAVPELPPSRPVSLFPHSGSTGLCSGYSCSPFK